MKTILAALTLSLSFSAFADRSVSISVPQGKLEITNPSTVNVNYTIECYDKVSGSNIVTGQSNQTLQPKKVVSVAAGGTCAGGAAPAKSLPQGPFFCSGSVTYASAGTLCGPSSHTCTIGEIGPMGINPTDFLQYYWLKPHASTTTWYSTYDAWSKSNNPQDTTTGKKPYAPTTYNKGTSYRCSTGSNGTGDAMSGCSTGMSSSTTSGTFCCPDNAGFASCKVTIHGTGASAGHLQSPQFKGGSPF